MRYIQSFHVPLFPSRLVLRALIFAGARFERLDPQAGLTHAIAFLPSSHPVYLCFTSVGSVRQDQMWQIRCGPPSSLRQ